MEKGKKYYYDNGEVGQIVVLGTLKDIQPTKRNGRNVYHFENDGILRNFEVEISDEELKNIHEMTTDLNDIEPIKKCMLELNQISTNSQYGPAVEAVPVFDNYNGEIAHGKPYYDTFSSSNTHASPLNYPQNTQNTKMSIFSSTKQQLRQAYESLKKLLTYKKKILKEAEEAEKAEEKSGKKRGGNDDINNDDIKDEKLETYKKSTENHEQILLAQQAEAKKNLIKKLKKKKVKQQVEQQQVKQQQPVKQQQLVEQQQPVKQQKDQIEILESELKNIQKMLSYMDTLEGQTTTPAVAGGKYRMKHKLTKHKRNQNKKTRRFCVKNKQQYIYIKNIAII